MRNEKGEVMESPTSGTREPDRVLPFEQQARESNKAFAAFKTYLELGAQRSLALVAGQHGKSKTLIERWSRRFGWTERVAAHAAHLAVVEREAIEAVARAKGPQWEAREQQLRETEWAMHERAIAAAKRGLDAYMERDKVYANLADIARMLEIASKLGRLATGLGTDGGGRKGDDLPAVRVEVTVALDKIYGEPLPGEVVDMEEVQSPESEVQSQSLLTSAATEEKP